MAQDVRVAVLIDADNISPSLAPAIIAETAQHGILGVKRIYGDWTTRRLTRWKDVLPRLAIQPQQQFAYKAGKNATDSALIVDAMDLLYAGNVDLFCIVANDSDYTRLAVRLRESGKRVFGLGSRDASRSFQNACDRYTFLEVLDEHIEVRDAEASTVAPLAPSDTSSATEADQTSSDRQTSQAARLEEAAKIIVPAIGASANDDGWAQLATVGWSIVNNNPTFDSRNYGYAKLSALVRSIDAIETKIEPDANNAGQIWTRLRD